MDDGGDAASDRNDFHWLDVGDVGGVYAVPVVVALLATRISPLAQFLLDEARLRVVGGLDPLLDHGVLEVLLPVVLVDDALITLGGFGIEPFPLRPIGATAGCVSAKFSTVDAVL